MKNLMQLTGNWKDLQRKLKQKFVNLSDIDLLLIEGRQDDMIQRLQIRLGKSREEVITIILAL
jgi:uncharacterized protein YjbJ (UPF0337 family)